MIPNWTRQSEKLRFSIRPFCRIDASEMLERSAAYLYEHHTQHDIRYTPHDNIGDAGLAAVTPAAARPESA